MDNFPENRTEIDVLKFSSEKDEWLFTDKIHPMVEWKIFWKCECDVVE